VPQPKSIADKQPDAPNRFKFRESETYKNLSENAKAFVEMAYNAIEFGNEQDAKIFSDAITQAKAIADPYFKAQLGLAEAEVKGAISERQGDFQTKSEIVSRTKRELLEDIKLSKDFLTLEQQAEMVRLGRDYDQDLLTISDQAAEKGLTFATGARSRMEAERRRTEKFQDVVQSSQRLHNLKVKELELRASRGDIKAQKDLEALQEERKFSLQRIGRAAEEVLGSARAGTMGLGAEGFAPVGEAIGRVEEEKRRAVISDVGALTELQRNFL
jgi:hypothetical protein